MKGEGSRSASSHVVFLLLLHFRERKIGMQNSSLPVPKAVGSFLQFDALKSKIFGFNSLFTKLLMGERKREHHILFHCYISIHFFHLLSLAQHAKQACLLENILSYALRNLV